MKLRSISALIAILCMLVNSGVQAKPPQPPSISNVQKEYDRLYANDVGRTAEEKLQFYLKNYDAYIWKETPVIPCEPDFRPFNRAKCKAIQAFIRADLVRILQGKYQIIAPIAVARSPDKLTQYKKMQQTCRMRPNYTEPKYSNPGIPNSDPSNIAMYDPGKNSGLRAEYRMLDSAKAFGLSALYDVSSGGEEKLYMVKMRNFREAPEFKQENTINSFNNEEQVWLFRYPSCIHHDTFGTGGEYSLLNKDRIIPRKCVPPRFKENTYFYPLFRPLVKELCRINGPFNEPVRVGSRLYQLTIGGNSRGYVSNDHKPSAIMLILVPIKPIQSSDWPFSTSGMNWNEMRFSLILKNKKAQ
jgi:hypothetical protein